jgi:transposase
MTTRTQHRRPSFDGQDLYIGLDVHKKSWTVSIQAGNCSFKPFNQPPTVQALTHYLEKEFPGASYHCVYEAGYSGFWIHDGLRSHGIDCMVVNPADVPTTGKDRTFKSDRVDAQLLARSLHQGVMKSIYVPSEAELSDRSLMRTRHELVEKQTRCKNQIKAFLYFHGVMIPEEYGNGGWTKKLILWLQGVELPERSATLSLRLYVRELMALRQLQAEVTRELRILAKTEDYEKSVKLLTSIPGVGVTTAMTLLMELVSFDRFRGTGPLASYIGLVPGSHSSGEHERSTGISHRGNSYVRHALIESAWIAVRNDPALLFAFNEYKKRMPANKAIVKIARKLLNRMVHVMKKKELYVKGVLQ